MLAIAGGKGGCGKTTTTLGIAAALAGGAAPDPPRDAPAAAPAGPLAVDADWDMPNLHRLAGADREPTLTDLLHGDAEWDDVPVADGVGAGVDAADGPAGASAATADVRVLPAPRDPPTGGAAIARLLERVDRADDGPIILDCPAGAGPDAAAPLRVADRAVVVAAPRPADLRAAAKTAALARALGTPVAGVVATRVREPIGERRRRAVERLLGAPLLAAVPEGRPPVLDRGAVRRAYRRAVRRLSDASPSDSPVSGVS